MIIFPLLYPDVFAKFRTQPPRGVLFVGPPGTGKTLTARALANSVSRESTSDGKKISFFMRKGADCLSKWVGEGERQLRLLFEQVLAIAIDVAYKWIINKGFLFRRLNAISPL
jgi:SpoVK/Ycf46/Vps4 family AAA+-type ATPase